MNLPSNARYTEFNFILRLGLHIYRDCCLDRVLLSHRQTICNTCCCCCWSVCTSASTNAERECSLCPGPGVITCRDSTCCCCCCSCSICAGVVDLPSAAVVKDIGSSSVQHIAGTDRLCRAFLRAIFSARAFCVAPAMACLTASKRRSSASCPPGRHIRSIHAHHKRETQSCR